MGLIVSIHDVSPLTRHRTEEILRDLNGVAAVSLLVIPNHHHRAPIADSDGKCPDPAFAQWLQEKSRALCEPVLHGYFHHREPRSGDSAAAAWINRHYTAGEGEFFDLGFHEATKRLRQGRADMLACGVHPVGFIAPAWLLGQEAARAVTAEGFLYTTRLDRMEFLNPCHPPILSQSLVWSVRAAWRRSVSLLWNAFLFRRLQGRRMLRVGIHPPDWDHSPIRNQILALVRKALAAHEPMTYHQCVMHTHSQHSRAASAGGSPTLPSVRTDES